MAEVVERSNAKALQALRAVLFGLAVLAALSALSFEPRTVAIGVAVVAGVLAAFSPGVATIVAVAAMALPVLAADFIVGAAFLVLGLATSQFLGQDGGRPFLIIALAFAGAAWGPAWTAAAVAGYLLGASEGAVAAILACLALEIAGLVSGHEFMGLVAAGGAPPGLVSFAEAPGNLLSFAWLGPAVESLEPQPLLDTLLGAGSKTLLGVQPVVWGLAAGLAGMLRRSPRDPRRRTMALLSAVVGVLVAGLGTTIAFAIFGDADTAIDALTVALGSSLLVAVAVVAAGEWPFRPVVRALAPAVRPGSMSAEDADVDELLRLIAAAEDELASKHTTTSVVMLTDMKSFSKMTEEDGSVMSAKTIQRHRDLLLPIIQNHTGHGKSTGGDGLVAAFTSAAEALNAAAEMQGTLQEYNTDHASERDIIVRIGIATGEVVLDKGGRPFIGTALNLAARVMNLADGGQVFVTREIADAGSGDLSLHSHGAFELKNIAHPVEVLELLWAEDQKPLAPGRRS